MSFVGGVQKTSTKVQMILFADDVLLVTEEEKDMEKKLEALDKAMEKWDMKVHWGKTKVMRISKREERCNVRVNGRDVKELKQMKYLGIMMNANPPVRKRLNTELVLRPESLGQ